MNGFSNLPHNILNKIIRMVQDYIGAFFIRNFKERKVHTTKCKKEELPEVLRIYKENFGGGAEKNIGKYQRIFNNVFFVIKKDKYGIMGYCSYYIHLKLKKWKILKIATIYSFAVDEIHKGEGIGTILLKESINELTENNVNIIRLFVNVENQPAIHLYKKLGFVERDIYKDICGQEQTCYCMELILDTFNRCLN